VGTGGSEALLWTTESTMVKSSTSGVLARGVVNYNSGVGTRGAIAPPPPNNQLNT
jgi:hypothetical protein